MRTTLSLGTVLGERYRVISVIGEGGMGTVYKAEDLKLNGKIWAIKQTYRSPEEYQLCLNEADVLMQLKHAALPNIVDFFPPDKDGCSYLVMDLVEGVTLETLFRQANQQLHHNRIVDAAVQLCEVLDYLHQCKSEAIIYRDIKPANVMVDRNHRITLIDFGIARSFKAGKIQDTVPIGTIGFAAPEQYDQKQTDERTDLYCLGAMLYYLLSYGKYYFIAQQPLHVMETALPRRLCAIVDCLLQTNPDHRYQSAAALRTELLQFMDADANKNTILSNHRMRATPSIITRKIIIIYGMYSGSGATFTSLSLARVLHHKGIPHVLIEHPANAPELKQLLGLGGGPSDAIMMKGHTRLVVFPGENSQLNCAKEQELEQAIVASVEPIIIIDASYGDLTSSLLRRATHVLCVANSMPSKLSELSIEHIIEQLNTWRASGLQVHCIANRDLPFYKRKDWLDALPLQPIVILPDVPYSFMVDTLWKSKLIEDDVTMKMNLLTSWESFVDIIIPEIHRTGSKYGHLGDGMLRMIKWVFKKSLQ